MRCWAATSIVLAGVMAATPTRAFAQVGNKIAVGVATTTRLTDNAAADGAFEIGVQWRILHDRPGWGFQYDAINWFNTDIHQTVAGQLIQMGDLRIRPILAGYGYTWTRPRLAITADLIGGLAINSFKLEPAADARYQALGARGLDADAGNTFVAKPEVHVWIDLSEKFGLKVTGGYIFARPTVTIRSTLGDDVRQINADTVMINVGLVYRIF